MISGKIKNNFQIIVVGGSYQLSCMDHLVDKDLRYITKAATATKGSELAVLYYQLFICFSWIIPYFVVGHLDCEREATDLSLCFQSIWQLFWSKSYGEKNNLLIPLVEFGNL